MNWVVFKKMVCLFVSCAQPKIRVSRCIVSNLQRQIENNHLTSISSLSDSTYTGGTWLWRSSTMRNETWEWKKDGWRIIMSNPLLHSAYYQDDMSLRGMKIRRRSLKNTSLPPDSYPVCNWTRNLHHLHRMETWDPLPPSINQISLLFRRATTWAGKTMVHIYSRDLSFFWETVHQLTFNHPT